MDYSGVTPAWQALLERAGAPACYAAAVAAAAGGETVEDRSVPAEDRIAPARSDVLRAFRCADAPEDIAVVIIGQDPYHTVRKDGTLVADGLAFSARGPPPPSLANVLKAVNAGAPGRRSGSLQHWASQGVLLTNAALTVPRGGPAGGHQKIWRPFISGLAEGLARARSAESAPLHVLLWGGKARAHRARFGLIPGAVIHEWSHPSPLADNRLPAEKKFAACPHFRAVNEARLAAGAPAIEWDAAAPTWISCSKSAETITHFAPTGVCAMYRGHDARRLHFRSDERLLAHVLTRLLTAGVAGPVEIVMPLGWAVTEETVTAADRDLLAELRSRAHVRIRGGTALPSDPPPDTLEGRALVDWIARMRREVKGGWTMPI